MWECISCVLRTVLKDYFCNLPSLESPVSRKRTVVAHGEGEVSDRFSSVLSCEDLLISSLHRSANIWIFIYLKSIGSIGRAPHRYRRGNGFKSRTGLNFFQVLFTTTRFSSVLGFEYFTTKQLHYTIRSGFFFLCLLSCRERIWANLATELIA